MPQSSQRQAASGGSGSHRRGSHGHHHHHRSSRRWPALLLGGVLVLEIAAIATTLYRLNVAGQENSTLKAQEQTSTSELEALRLHVAKLRLDLDILNKGRLPDLQPLDLNQVIAIDRDYMKSIVFTPAGRGDRKNYEYSLVMENSSLSMVKPEIDLYFFDRTGTILGHSRIGYTPGGSAAPDMLERSETRSFTDRVELPSKPAPAYFRAISRTR